MCGKRSYEKSLWGGARLHDRQRHPLDNPSHSTAINAFVKYEQVHSRTLPSGLFASEHSGRRLRIDEIGTAPNDQWEAKL